jgi:biopolymer transport protein ExbD
MAVMKKKRKGGIPPISTASLPDVIFMILFFFMISTSMRQTDTLVYTVLPSATEVSKLEKKQLVSYIYIGRPVESEQAQWGTAPKIQLNDSYRDAKFIGEFVASEREKLSEADRAAMTVMLKADKSVRMGMIAEVKMELRRANALKISYAAQKALSIGGGR